MVGKALTGHPTVKRFVRDHYYYIEEISNSNHWIVLRFRKTGYRQVHKKNNIILRKMYLFEKVAENSDLNKQFKSQYTALDVSTIQELYIKEISVEDFPLYMNAQNIYPAFKKAFQEYNDPYAKRKKIIKKRYRK